MSLYKYTGEDNFYLTKGGEYDIDIAGAGDYHTTIDDKGVKHELSTGFILDYFKPKAEANPVYTQAMADNGELPIVGMEVTYGDHKTPFTVILKADIDDLYILSPKGLDAWHSGYIEDIKPITPPIELINGGAYQYDVDHNSHNGIYNEFKKAMYSVHSIACIEYCTNIKHLTV